jgi:hypothetical protein
VADSADERDGAIDVPVEIAWREDRLKAIAARKEDPAIFAPRKCTVEPVFGKSQACL